MSVHIRYAGKPKKVDFSDNLKRNNKLHIEPGLQKINFGSATMLRPLMWFDQVDPRDPLQLTDGVWGVLGRYYFLNNANIWLWGLYGNKNPGDTANLLVQRGDNLVSVPIALVVPSFDVFAAGVG